MEKTFMEAMETRYSSKKFDPERTLSKEDLTYILESGRLSPSSFGLEPWHFIVIRDPEIKEALRPHCWNQPQITTCSDLVVFLTRKDLQADAEYVKGQFERWGIGEEGLAFVLKLYGDFIAQYTTPEARTAWAGKQSYIALGNMLTAAKVKDIDSCAIEGFIPEKVIETLKIDPEVYDLHVLAAFGYRGDEPRKKHRLSLNQIVEYR